MRSVRPDPAAAIRKVMAFELWMTEAPVAPVIVRSSFTMVVPETVRAPWTWMVSPGWAASTAE